MSAGLDPQKESLSQLKKEKKIKVWSQNWFKLAQIFHDLNFTPHRLFQFTGDQTWKVFTCVIFQETHLVHDDFALSRLCHVDHSLDNIVCVLVLHHGVQGAVGPVFLAAHFIDQESSLCTRGVDHALFHDVTEERSSWLLTHSPLSQLSQRNKLIDG